MKWILGASVIAVVAGMAATMTLPAQTISPDEAILKLLPRETNGVAFVDLASLRSAPLYDETVVAQFRAKLPPVVVEFGEATGIVFDRDLDSVTVGRVGSRQMVAIAYASFDKFKVEQYLNDKQVQTETYLGRVIFHPRSEGGVCLVDNLVIAGHTEAVKKVIERLAAPGESVLQNPGLLDSIKAIEAGSQVWAAGEFDTRLLPDQPEAPVQIAELMKSLQGGTYQMRIDQDVHVVATARFTDPEKARMTGDLLRGLIAVAKLQLSRQPDMIGLLDGVRVQESGLSMTVNFDVSGELLEKLQNMRKSAAE
jgi:hypothetical protein